ncbi:MAG: hypothetical protein KF830_16255 [Planctomycetes bacterium]|nr:hypothetical protein [Planctomycetota bacterium]
MPPSPATAIAAFSRRAAAGAFAAAVARAVGVAAVGVAALAIAARLSGAPLEPAAWWAALLLPVLACGVARARRERPDRTTAAAHLDRRLGLAGLLLCAHEGAGLDEAQRTRLAEGLAALPTALPRLRWRTLLPWPSAALLLAAVTVLLPAPAPAPALPFAAAAAELERLAERLHELVARGPVPADAAQELERQLAELQQRLAAGDRPEWRDLDALDRRLEREQLLQAAAAAARPGTPAASATAVRRRPGAGAAGRGG